jgi:hypothetical protein
MAFLLDTNVPLIAATAITHGLVVATRNIADFLSSAVPVVNPFE